MKAWYWILLALAGVGLAALVRRRRLAWPGYEVEAELQYFPDEVTVTGARYRWNDPPIQQLYVSPCETDAPLYRYSFPTTTAGVWEQV